MHRAHRKRLALVVAGSMLVTACSGSTVEQETTTSAHSVASTTETSVLATLERPSEPPYGGTARIGISGMLTLQGATLNPLLTTDEAMFDVARLVVPGAYRVNAATGEMTPWLLSSLPTLDNGGVTLDGDSMTVTWEVRQNAVWEDGTPITGEDLAFTYDLVHSLGPDMGPTPYDLIDADSVEIDGKTMTARLTEPDIAYEQMFEWVLPAHVIDSGTFDSDWNSALWPSGGPFSFVSYDPPPTTRQPGVIVLEANRRYWESTAGGPLPYLDAIEITVFESGTTTPDQVVEWVTGGEGDAIIGIESLPAPGSIADPSPGLESELVFDGAFTVLGFNLAESRLVANPHSNSDDPAFRAAVLAALDRDGLATKLGVEPMTSILGAAIPSLDHDAWNRYDGSETDAGSGAILISTTTGRGSEEIGAAVTDMLVAGGFAARSSSDPDFYSSTWPNRDLDAYLVWAFDSYGVGLSGVVDALGVFDPRVDSLALWADLDEPVDAYHDVLDQARTELDRAELISLIENAETILAENAVVYPLVRRQGAYRIWSPDRITGIVANPAHGWDTWNAAEWMVP